MKTIDTLALILLIVGGLNWGLVGLFDYNLVTTIFGIGSTLTKGVYSLVALSSLYYILFWQSISCRCTHNSCCKK
ncbi:MAG: DUF378 domain-containing protein [Chlamydia sp.]